MDSFRLKFEYAEFEKSCELRKTTGFRDPPHANSKSYSLSKVVTLEITEYTFLQLTSLSIVVNKMTEAKPLSQEEVNAACHAVPPETKDFLFQQTMYRIKDPKKSLEFYTKVVGMCLLKQFHFDEMKFSLYFMGYENPTDIPIDEKDRTRWAMSRKATLELTHNWGTENDADFKYHNGNSDPRGFGHIGIMVPDVDAACERFASLGVEFIKKPTDGKMKGIAFIKDPDGYWIEIFNNMMNF